MSDLENLKRLRKTVEGKLKVSESRPQDCDDAITAIHLHGKVMAYNTVLSIIDSMLCELDTTEWFCGKSNTNDQTQSPNP